MSLSVDSAFSAKQSILHAEGHYTYTGGLWAGYRGGKWQSTTATQLRAQTDMGQSVKSISLGINSLVMASSVRAMVGIGAFGFNTGVYVGMRFDGTILRAPDQAFPCKQGTIEVYIDSGVGCSMPGFVVDLINKLLALFTKYKLQRVGTLLKGPSPDRLFHGNTQIDARHDRLDQRARVAGRMSHPARGADSHSRRPHDVRQPERVRVHLDDRPDRRYSRLHAKALRRAVTLSPRSIRDFRNRGATKSLSSR